jgi:hypothetical protein
MWNPLANAEQLSLNCKLKKVLLDGNFQHESIYQVTTIGNYYFVIKYLEQNEIEIPDEYQWITPYTLAGIMHYGFEIWIE